MWALLASLTAIPVFLTAAVVSPLIDRSDHPREDQLVNPEPTAPRTADPDVVSAILRSDDTGPDALYPCQIGVYCDDCGTTVKRDYLVNDNTSKPARLEIARSHLRNEGWICDATGDFCPPCAPKGPTT